MLDHNSTQLNVHVQKSAQNCKRLLYTQNAELNPASTATNRISRHADVPDMRTQVSRTTQSAVCVMSKGAERSAQHQEHHHMPPFIHPATQAPPHESFQQAQFANQRTQPPNTSCLLAEPTQQIPHSPNCLQTSKNHSADTANSGGTTITFGAGRIPAAKAASLTATAAFSELTNTSPGW